MTLIAGVFSRRGQSIDEAIFSALKKNLSRNESDRVEVHSDARVCLMKVDIGALGAPGVYRDERGGSVSFLAGEPLLKSGNDDPGRERDADLKELHQSLSAGSLSALKSATGIFSVAHYDPKSETLTLVTDKIGHRAIYYRLENEWVVFASVLRVMEALPLPKTMDVLALGEMTVYPRHPLAARTPYCEIKRMLSGEMLQFRGESVRSQIYFDFGSIPQVSEGDEKEFVRESHERFMSAIRRRLRSDRTVASCLSGGLDSRAVVSGLRALDTRVYTVNMYQFYNSQDRVYGAMLAEAAGTIHSEVSVPYWVSGKTFERIATEATGAALARNGEKPERPLLLWTGDGGSVSSGHLHIEQDLADMVREGRWEDAFRVYHLGGVHRGILTDIADQLEKVMIEAFLEEMKTIKNADPARAFHVFLIKDHQRKDFVAHFEHIDVHRIEFQCPFYDSDYLESIVRLPFEWTVAHRFYHKWMRLFPPFATSVPWQTYDGHEACPLPPAPGVARQWDDANLEVVAKARQKELVRKGREVLNAKLFPHPLIRHNRMRLATLLHWLGLRNCEATINLAATFNEYWNRCGGAYYLPKRFEWGGECEDGVAANAASGAEAVGASK